MNKHIGFRLAYTIAPTLFLGTGCIAVSMHTSRDVLITVTETSTGEPVREAPIRVEYTYDSYGVVRILRTPHPLEAKTDGNGRALVSLADYSYCIALKVDLKRTGDFAASTPYFLLDKKHVRAGGTVTSVRVGRFPQLRLVMEPAKKGATLHWTGTSRLSLVSMVTSLAAAPGQ
jgi:hypothetical protein